MRIRIKTIIITITISNQLFAANVDFGIQPNLQNLDFSLRH